jgi:hypothetical protein
MYYDFFPAAGTCGGALCMKTRESIIDQSLNFADLVSEQLEHGISSGTVHTTAPNNFRVLQGPRSNPTRNISLNWMSI